LKGISYIFLGYDGTLPTSNDEGSTPIKARSRYWPEGWFALGDMADERELAGVEGRLSCLFVFSCFVLASLLWFPGTCLLHVLSKCLVRFAFLFSFFSH
jgi:hypothetical protein